MQQSNAVYYISGFIRMCSDIKNNSSQKGKLHHTSQGVVVTGLFLVVLSISKS